ncbi:MAG: hypothetical protein MUF00_11690 [Gemmatimonadaceae bacterium]|nr:hypothetical protein [Gemmatimonadaceae bacterium]
MAGISLVSCSDSTVVEPPPVGTYVLATIAGQSLPANIIAAPAGLVFLTQADTIVLSDDGTARKREVGERVSGSGAPPGPYRTDERLRFTLTDAGVIELTYPCEGAALRADALVSSSAAAPETPRTLSCVAGPHFRGRVTADELVLTESNVGRRVPLRYRRVR